MSYTTINKHLPDQNKTEKAIELTKSAISQLKSKGQKVTNRAIHAITKQSLQTIQKYRNKIEISVSKDEGVCYCNGKWAEIIEPVVKKENNINVDRLKSLKDRLKRRLRRFEELRDPLLIAHKGNELKFTYWGGFDLGYLKGQICIIEDMFDELDDLEDK